jgi:hypothetical protein
MAIGRLKTAHRLVAAAGQPFPVEHLKARMVDHYRQCGRLASEQSGGSLAAKRTCLVVLGMHRSGTSAVAGTLGRLGATFPEDVLGANPTNPRGHFESNGVLAANEQILRAIDTAWYDFRHINCASLDAAIVQEFRAKLSKALQGSYGDASLFVLKDPRFCRFFPLARSAIEDFGVSPKVAFCFRNPLEVAASLKIRDGISLSHGLSLWLRHMVDAELHSRDLPRVFINFSDFLRNWRETVSQIERGLGIVFPGWQDNAASEVDRFVDVGLRHNLASRDQLEECSGGQGWVRSCYEAFSELVRNPNDTEAMRNLDLIRTAFDQTASFFGAAVQDYYSELLQLRIEVQLHRAEQEEANSRLEEANSRLEEANSRLEEAQGRLERVTQDEAMLTAQLADIKRQLKAIRRSRSWRFTAPIRSAVTSLRRLTLRRQ